MRLMPFVRPWSAGLVLSTITLGAPASFALATRPATAAKVPEPKDVFGFKPGEDYKVFTWEQDVDYFKKLDASSDRIVVEEIGKTTLGKPMLLAFISSEINLKNRLRYKEIAKQLALTKGVDEAKARALAQEGKAIVWIDGGMHSTEIANSHSMPELAHWLVTDESAEARRIRDNVILLLMPHLNPDGIDIAGDWYKKNLGTPFETTTQPEVYQHYIGHDNNRDWYMFTQIETRAVAKQLYEEWFPEIVYNHHQSSPFPGRIAGPPMKNPVNPNLDPLLVSTVNQIGEHMRKRFDLEGKPGYNSGIVYDMWWNGSMRGVPISTTWRATSRRPRCIAWR
ncbi:MAG: M14 family metallopeptidase, partial [Vicinamibacteria bacterium]